MTINRLTVNNNNAITSIKISLLLLFFPLCVQSSQSICSSIICSPLSLLNLKKSVHKRRSSSSSSIGRLRNCKHDYYLTSIRGGATGPSSSFRIPPKPTNQGRYSSTQQLSQQETDDDETGSIWKNEESLSSTKEALNSFLTRDSRNTFIARVYTILSCQLITTALSCILFGTNAFNLRNIIYFNPIGKALPFLAVLTSTIVYFILGTSATARRKAPLKWQLLTLFTLGESISVGFLSSFYKFESVCISMFTTAVAAIVISAYTILQKNAKYDLSQWGQTLSTWGMIFVVYGIIQLLQIMGILPAGLLPYNDAIYSFFGACLFSAYLAYHTKMIVSNEHTKYQMNEKDYVFASISLYVDIVNMFLYILRVIGEDRE